MQVRLAQTVSPMFPDTGLQNAAQARRADRRTPVESFKQERE